MKQFYTRANNLYGFRNQTSSDVYNYLRIQFDAEQRRELRFEPITGWEIRNDQATGSLYVIDSKVQGNPITVNDGNMRLTFQGEQVSRNSDTFQIKAFVNPNDDSPKFQLGLLRMMTL